MNLTEILIMWQPIQLEKTCKICDGPIVAKRKRDLGKEVCGRKCAGQLLYQSKDTWKPVVLDRPCQICNGIIMAKRKRDLNKEVCGRKCAGQFYIAKAKIYVQCLHCKKEFLKTCRTQNKYCSKKCCAQTKVKIHKRRCARCKKEFILQNIAYERRGGGRFCSQECGAKTYHWDESFFELIDTEQKAYWLGFIAADGCVDHKEFRLHISERDVEHLKEFKSAIQSTHPIHYTANKSVTFIIGNKKIVKNLNALGIVHRKTLILEYPDIPKRLNRHFIRGVFDGDGCIGEIKGGHSKHWSIYTASPKFKDQLIAIIQKETGVTLSVYPQYKGFHIKLHKRQFIQAMDRYLYKDATIFLSRKKLKFQYTTGKTNSYASSVGWSANRKKHHKV